MADFFQTPADLEQTTVDVYAASPLEPLYASSGAEVVEDIDITSVTFEGLNQPQITLLNIETPFVYLGIPAGGVFLDALLAAQLEASRGPRYPTTGQRWPWKAFG